MRAAGFAIVVTVAIAALSAGPVFAGGWAVTTLDSLPGKVFAGQTYQVGYMVRQHGLTPFTSARPRILVSLDGQHLSFGGQPEGAAGHYVSAVQLPSAGTWSWAVDQTPFGTQELGTLEVLPPLLPEMRAQSPAHTSLAAPRTVDDMRMIPWAWGWPAVGSTLVLGVVGLRVGRRSLRRCPPHDRSGAEFRRSRQAGGLRNVATLALGSQSSKE